MPSAYVQVCRTYIRRTFSSWAVCLCVLANLPGLIAVMIAPKILLHGGLQGFFMPMGFIGYLTWLHFREQMINQRRFLLPGFLWPHLLVFAIFASLLAVVAPLEMTWHGRLDSIGLLACGMAFFALLGWCVVTLSLFLFAGTWILWMALMWDALGGKINAFISGGFERQAYLLLAAGIAAAALAIIRLCRLNEDHSAYRRAPDLGMGNMRARMTGEVHGNWSSKPGQLFSVVLGSLVAPAGAGVWRKALAWSSLGRGNAVAIAGLLLALVAVIIWTPGGGLSVISPHLLIALLMVLSLIFSMIISPRWMMMWRHLETAFLFPIERSDFLRQIGLAIAINFVEAWAYLAAIFVALMWWLIPKPIEWGIILTALGAAASLQILSYGISIWLLRFRSPGWFLLGGAALNIGVAILAVATELIGNESLIPFLHIMPVLSAAMAVVGVFIALDAWGWWLVTELG